MSDPSEPKGKKKALPVTEAQKAFLIEFVKNNNEMLTKKFSATVTKARVDGKWKELSLYLNNMDNGTVKSPDKWKKCFSDLTRNVKKKLSVNKKYLTGTGGGPSQQITLNQNEQELSELVPSAAISGLSVAESSVKFNFSGKDNGHSFTKVCLLNQNISLLDDFPKRVDDDMFVENNVMDVDEYFNPMDIGMDGMDDMNRSADAHNPIEADGSSIVKNEVQDDDTGMSTKKILIDSTNISTNETPRNGVEKSKSWSLPTAAAAKNLTTMYKDEEKENDFTPFPPGKRTHSANRQAASVKNGERMIEIATENMQAKGNYYKEKIIYMRRAARQKSLELRINMNSKNKLTNPWPSI